MLRCTHSAPFSVISVLLLLLVLVGSVQAQGVAARFPVEQYLQTPPGPLAQRVTVQTQRQPLEAVLREIGRQAGLVLVFSTDLAAATEPRPLELRDVTAAQALVRVLEGTGLKSYLLPDWKVLILRETEPPGNPPAPPAVQGQTVRGRVVDRDTQAPLFGATILVRNTDPLLGTTTDLDGNFVLNDVPLGRHDFQVSYIGYEPLVLPNVVVSSGKEVVLDVALKEAVVVGEVIEVTPEVQKELPLNDMATVSARSFSVEETRRYAGAADDPARMAAAFAGVTASAGIESNALVIRGNAPKGVLWRLEGVEIPNPTHFAGMSIAGGGGLTLFSQQLLADSDFFTSAFPAEYGNALAGVFDMYFRTGNAARREYTVQAGVLGVEAAVEGPFVPGRPSTYLLNYRYSTLGLMMPLLPTEDVATYQDLSFKFSFPTKNAGRFDVWGIGGLDRQTQHEKPDSTQWEYARWDRVNAALNLGVGAAGIGHHLVLGRRSYLKTTAAVTANRTHFDQYRLDDELALQPNLFIHSTTGRFILSAYLNHKFSARHVNRSGFTVQRLFYDLDLQVAPNDHPPVVPVASGSGANTLLGLYTQSRFDFGRLMVNAGLHAQYFALTDHATLEPRLGVRWQVTDGQALSAGYGLHSQIEDLRMYHVRQGDLRPNERLDFARAHHAVLGYDRQFNASTRLKLETYLQYLYDVPVIPDSSFSLLNFEQDWAFNEVLVNDGAGLNYGLDLTLERFLRDGYYYLATGSLFRSRYRGGDGVWRSTRFDQGYVANLLFGKEFAFGARQHLLGLNGRAVVMGGQRRSPVDEPASLARKEVVYDEARAFVVREAGVFVLDFTVTYRLNRRHFAEVWALQLKNVLAAKERYHDYSYRTRRIEEIAEGYPLPILSYKIEF